MTEYRIEQDTLGKVRVPAKALYGAQTQRAIDNFPVSGWTMPEPFIRALLLVKSAAARANDALDLLDKDIAKAITRAIEQLLGNESMMQAFPIDVFQTGSGTSTNMNANEVIACLAAELCQQAVNPNDHVNCGQSSNDVIPTTIHVSAVLEIERHLLPNMEHLSQVIRGKARTVKSVVKTGRTHLMDAVPIRFDQVLSGWATQIDRDVACLRALLPQMQRLAQGGTAVGTGLNAYRAFPKLFNEELSRLTGIEFSPAEDFVASIASQDMAVQLSGQLKTVAVSLMKIANDLRWMNSGPLAGLGEITLEALQPGSSIMPGKVNPVIPESVAMVAAQVMGNDTAITIAGQSGNFELNTMLPLIAHNLLTNIHLLANASQMLADKAINSFQINEDKVNESLQRNPILATALNPIIGYEKAATIAKTAYKENRPVLDVAEEMTGLSRARLEGLLKPENLTEPAD